MFSIIFVFMLICFDKKKKTLLLRRYLQCMAIHVTIKKMNMKIIDTLKNTGIAIDISIAFCNRNIKFEGEIRLISVNLTVDTEKTPCWAGFYLKLELFKHKKSVQLQIASLID